MQIVKIILGIVLYLMSYFSQALGPAKLLFTHSDGGIIVLNIASQELVKYSVARNLYKPRGWDAIIKAGDYVIIKGATEDFFNSRTLSVFDIKNSKLNNIQSSLWNKKYISQLDISPARVDDIYLVGSDISSREINNDHTTELDIEKFNKQVSVCHYKVSKKACIKLLDHKTYTEITKDDPPYWNKVEYYHPWPEPWTSEIHNNRSDAPHKQPLKRVFSAAISKWLTKNGQVETRSLSQLSELLSISYIDRKKGEAVIFFAKKPFKVNELYYAKVNEKATEAEILWSLPNTTHPKINELLLESLYVIPLNQ